MDVLLHGISKFQTLSLSSDEGYGSPDCSVYLRRLEGRSSWMRRHGSGNLLIVLILDYSLYHLCINNYIVISFVERVHNPFFFFSFFFSNL